MKLQRLLNMTVSESAYRGRQKTSKWFDRLGVTGGVDRASDAIFGKPAGMSLEDFGRATNRKVVGFSAPAGEDNFGQIGVEERSNR